MLNPCHKAYIKNLGLITFLFHADNNLILCMTTLLLRWLLYFVVLMSELIWWGQLCATADWATALPLASHIEVPGWIPAAPCPIQLAADIPGKAATDGQSTWTPLLGDPDGDPSSGFYMILAVVTICGELLGGCYVCICLSLSLSDNTSFM